LSLDPIEPLPQIQNDISLAVNAALRRLYLVDLALLVLEPLVIVRPDPIKLFARRGGMRVTYPSRPYFPISRFAVACRWA
jgi:hypothetical protein